MSKEKLICLTAEELRLRRGGGAVFSHRSACPQCRRSAEIARLKNEGSGESVDLCMECSPALPKEFQIVGWLVAVMRRGTRG